MPKDQASCMNIAATLTRDRHAHPLVVLDSQPFNGLEIRPSDLRQLAQQFIALADMAGKLPMGGKNWKSTTVQFGTIEVAV